MQKIILTRGYPGSGKTTWARAYCEKNQDYIRISRDDLRDMRGKYWIPKQEDMITDMVGSLVLNALENGKHVIIDATNLDDRTKKYVAELADGNYDVKIEYKDFLDVSVEECIKRDLKRERSVGKEVIMKFHKKWMKQTNGPIVDAYTPPPYDPSLPDCIISDIDGTVAHMKDRSPYDYTKVLTDIPDHTVIDVIKTYARGADDSGKEVAIIFLSGRKDECKEDTKNWLKDAVGYYSNLHMRKSDDTRKDSIVKQEIYEKEIKGKYNVLFVLDDRNHVVEMWREQGLKTLQVQMGDF